MKRKLTYYRFSAVLFASLLSALGALGGCSLDSLPHGWTEPELFYAAEEYYPAGVTEYLQAPGQFAQSDAFRIQGNTDKLLGPPVGGGTIGPDNSSVVSLGMAGGSVTLRFDPPIEDHPDNLGGYDFIVYGNGYWSGGNPENIWQEPGTVWVMKDSDGNGSPDDTWYLIPGSHLGGTDTAEDLTYDNQSGADPPPDDKIAEWWPSGADSPITVSGVFLLPDGLYPSGGSRDLCWGYCDAAPTLKLGDLSGAVGDPGENSLDDPEDYPGINPVYFYTTPDDHTVPGIDAGSGGGNSIDIVWAVDPESFTPADLDEISWVKIVSGTLLIDGTLGEYSCEVDAVVRVRRESP